MRAKCLQNTGPTLPGIETYKTAAPTTSPAWTSSVAGSPARTCHSPGNGQGSTGNAAPCGPSLPESLAKLSPDGCWLRTYQDCYQVMLDGSLEEFSETWPRSGTMQNGTVYRRQPLVPLTAVTEYSLWPTPRALVQGMECTAPPYKGRSHGWDLGGGYSGRSAAQPNPDVANANRESLGRLAESRGQCGQWAVEPDVDRVADGVPARVDRLRCLGNAVVPQVTEWIARRMVQALAVVAASH